VWVVALMAKENLQMCKQYLVYSRICMAVNINQLKLSIFTNMINTC